MKVPASKWKFISLFTISATLISLIVFFAMDKTREVNDIEGSSTAVVGDTARSRWLNSVKCDPPCWEGIVPGQTALQALETLKQLEFVTNITTHENQNTNIGEIEWDGADNEGDGRLFFHMENKSSDGEVFAIWPEMGCCENLGNVILSFGEPDFAFAQKVDPIVSPSSQEAISSYSVVWINKGFMVKGFPTEGTQIDKNFQIHTVIFFVPSWDGFIDFEGNAGSNAVVWHGYDDGLNYLAP